MEISKKSIKSTKAFNGKWLLFDKNDICIGYTKKPLSELEDNFEVIPLESIKSDNEQ